MYVPHTEPQHYQTLVMFYLEMAAVVQAAQ